MGAASMWVAVCDVPELTLMGVQTIAWALAVSVFICMHVGYCTVFLNGMGP